jgi:hypothetical protein
MDVAIPRQWKKSKLCYISTLLDCSTFDAKGIWHWYMFFLDHGIGIS